MPGGLSARDGNVTIPLRMFGDRQFSIIYDLREQLPEPKWVPALNQSGHWDRMRVRFVYVGVTAVACGAMFAVMYGVTH